VRYAEAVFETTVRGQGVSGRLKRVCQQIMPPSVAYAAYILNYFYGAHAAFYECRSESEDLRLLLTSEMANLNCISQY